MKNSSNISDPFNISSLGGCFSLYHSHQAKFWWTMPCTYNHKANWMVHKLKKCVRLLSSFSKLLNCSSTFWIVTPEICPLQSNTYFTPKKTDIFIEVTISWKDHLSFFLPSKVLATTRGVDFYKRTVTKHSYS